MKRRSISYCIAPTVVLALAAAASLGTAIDSAGMAAICARPAAILNDEPGCRAAARVTSARLAEVARRFHGQAILFPATPSGAHLAFACVLTPSSPASDHVLAGFGLVSPRLANLPPPLA